MIYDSVSQRLTNTNSQPIEICFNQLSLYYINIYLRFLAWDKHFLQVLLLFPIEYIVYIVRGVVEKSGPILLVVLDRT